MVISYFIQKNVTDNTSTVQIFLRALLATQTSSTFLTKVSMLLEKKGGSSVAIWYKMQPSAQMSAFSP